MFKSVKYEGFEDAPELQAKCERLSAVIDDQLRLAADRVSITWSLREPDPKAPTELGRRVILRLVDDWAGGDELYLFEAQLDETELVQGTVRRMRMDMLDRFLDRQVEQFKANLALGGV